VRVSGHGGEVQADRPALGPGDQVGDFGLGELGAGRREQLTRFRHIDPQVADPDVEDPPLRTQPGQPQARLPAPGHGQPGAWREVLGQGLEKYVEANSSRYKGAINPSVSNACIAG
jgi:hypothetical protein